MRRVRLSIASIVLAFVLAVALSATSGTATTYAADTQLSVLTSGVLVSHDGAAFVAGVDGESLHEGDTIKTGPGEAVVTYFEGSTVTIEPNSELTIAAMRISSDGGTIVLLTQLFGRTWNVVTKLITGGSRYEILTPTTTASVRGTKFEVDADADATTVNTTEGTVLQRVPVADGRVVDVPVRAGMTQTQRRGAPPTPATARPATKTVSIRLGGPNATIVDAQGRADGVRRGRVVALTPGAQVHRDNGSVVVTLPESGSWSLGRGAERGAAADRPRGHDDGRARGPTRD